MATHTLKEKLQIGREINDALDDIVPPEKRMTDAQIAKQLGVSPQYVTQTKLLALYKLRQRLLEIRNAARASALLDVKPGAWHFCGGRWCKVK
jgi:hypothetical protein